MKRKKKKSVLKYLNISILVPVDPLLKTAVRTTNRVNPDQMPRYAVSNLAQHCLSKDLG